MNSSCSGATMAATVAAVAAPGGVAVAGGNGEGPGPGAPARRPGGRRPAWARVFLFCFFLLATLDVHESRSLNDTLNSGEKSALLAAT